MGIARPIVVAILLLAVAGCNSDALPPASQFSALQGTIVDHATGRPIAGALVTVDTVLTAVTDANGAFTIAEVPSGDFDYTVQAKGYTTFSGTARAAPSKPFVLSVSLVPGQLPSDTRSTVAVLPVRS